MIYLYVLSNSGEPSSSVLEDIQKAYPRRLGRKAEVVGTEEIEGDLPNEHTQELHEKCLRVCEDKGVRFNAALDETSYAVQTIEDVDYGVCEINVLRYVRASLAAAAVAAFVVGAALGVTTVSTWLVAIGLGAYLFYLWTRGPVRKKAEGWLFATGPTIMMSWVAGFIVRGVVL